jgi:hypothetical protein
MMEEGGSSETTINFYQTYEVTSQVRITFRFQWADLLHFSWLTTTTCFKTNLCT